MASSINNIRALGEENKYDSRANFNRAHSPRFGLDVAGGSRSKARSPEDKPDSN